MQSDSDSGKKIYTKHQSFETFVSNIDTDIAAQTQRVVAALTSALASGTEPHRRDVWKAALAELENPDQPSRRFHITVPIADELSRVDDHDVARYAFHRYRYDVFPAEHTLDAYPPYLQIEPASVCNFRCVFCYQTDTDFTAKSGGHMGTMALDLYKAIVDQCAGHVDFISLASRGEPLVSKDITQMLDYSRGKFLGLKMNTNASLLTEAKCHAILSGGLNTLVFSADAAQEPLYSQLRVGGKLATVLKNIEMFREIQARHYPESRLITRVSGVKFNDDQSMDSMVNTWGPLVDQICFVEYNPWENVYVSPVSGVTAPCSDLWRRMFIWFDGTTNPCDTDYKSVLKMGRLGESDVSALWRSPAYEVLRQRHLAEQRGEQEPCRRCTVV